MYSIAVCDDEAEMARYIAKTVTGQFEAAKHPVQVCWHTDPAKLERQILGGEGYDALLLDIDMPGLDGIELCRHLRKRSGDVMVVFISNREELVFQTFEVSPFRFVRKSRFSAEIDKLCREMITELDRRKDRFLRFQDEREGTVYSVNIRKLMYVEASRKDCRLVSEGETMEVRIQFSELTEKLTEFGFILIHRSYLVNPYYIFRIDNCDVTLDDGNKLPLSRNRRTEVKDAFFRWYREGL